MNRAERRRLEKQGKKVAKDPVYNVKASDTREALLKNPAIKEIVDQEISKRILELDKQYALDMDSMVMWSLSQKGWGPKRCKDFYKLMFYWHRKLRAHYEIPECFPERLILKEKGIDVEAWFKEMFNEDGTYKQSLEEMLNDLRQVPGGEK